MFIQSLLTLKASRYLSSSSRRSLFGAVSTESSPSNFIVNLPALKASVADGGRVMLGIVRGLTKMKKNEILLLFLNIQICIFKLCMNSNPIMSKQDYGNSLCASFQLQLQAHVYTYVAVSNFRGCQNEREDFTWLLKC